MSGLGSSPINTPVRSQHTNALFWLTRSNSQGWVLVLRGPAKQEVTFHDSFTRSNHVLSFWRRNRESAAAGRNLRSPDDCRDRCDREARECRPGRSLEPDQQDRKSTRLNSSHVAISYAVFC